MISTETPVCETRRLCPRLMSLFQRGRGVAALPDPQPSFQLSSRGATCGPWGRLTLQLEGFLRKQRMALSGVTGSCCALPECLILQVSVGWPAVGSASVAGEAVERAFVMLMSRSHLQNRRDHSILYPIASAASCDSHRSPGCTGASHGQPSSSTPSGHLAQRSHQPRLVRYPSKPCPTHPCDKKRAASCIVCTWRSHGLAPL